MKLHTSCLKKRYYSTFELAERVASRCMVERPGTVLRVYHCSLCQHYHLTSQSEKSVPYARTV